MAVRRVKPLLQEIEFRLRNLAWKVAGYYGLDRSLLPLLGTPWKPGKVFAADRQSAAV